MSQQKKIFATLAAGGALLAAAAAWRGLSHTRRNAAAERRGNLLNPETGPAHRKFAEVDGMRISWLEQGEGTPVILLHGIPTSPELWRYVIPLLSEVRVLAWEMVGYGMSMGKGRGRDISVARQAEYLAAWMRQIGIEKAILVGHDLGGGVAQIAAVRHPGLCSGLFLTNAISYDSWPIPSVSAMKGSAGLMRKLPNSLFKILLMSLFYRGHDDPSEARAAYDVHADNYLAAGGAAALVGQVEQLDVNDTMAIVDRLPELRIPARVVWGEADQFQKIEYGRRLSDDLKAPFRTIAGGKHFTPEDHPQIIAEEIMELVRTVQSNMEGVGDVVGVDLGSP